MAYSPILKPNTLMNTKLYTGNGSTNNITGVGFQPDWVWTKCRSTVNSSRLIDAVRGVTKAIVSNSTGAEFTEANGLSAFGTDGYTLNGNLASMNTNSDTYVSWNWKANGAGSANTDGSISSTVSANTTSGFSIVSWTGTNATGTVGHGLGSTPKVVIYKNRTDVTNWYFTTTVIDGSNDLLFLNTTEASQTFSAPVATNSLLNLIANNDTNGSGDNIIAYCFAEKQGYSKFGSYTGNGNADGTFVYTGFKPAWVMVKNTNAVNHWAIYDNKRIGFNTENNYLRADGSYAEGSETWGDFDLLSNGFKPRATDAMINSSGNTFIYMAFAEEPLVASNFNVATAR